MAVTVATVLSRADLGIFDITWGADADVAAVVPHGIQGGGILGGGGVVPEVVIVGAQPANPGTAAAARLGDVRVNGAADATNVTLSKTNAGGSSPLITRLIVARKAAQLSAVNTALLSAVVGAMGGADAG